MKMFLFLLLSVSAATAGAKFLESHYGSLRTRGFEHHCAFKNNTGGTLDMKYVVFTFRPLSPDNNDYDVQERIDQIVRPGETAYAKIHESRDTAVYCRFLAR
ncbi:hypothetical protein ACES2L_08915 [Bdellovibrio bacteriovorus]